MKLFDLIGKTAVIIGAGVLGSAIARSFGQAGANIAIGYRSTPVDDLKNELEKLGVKNEDYQVDSANLERVASCRDLILQDFGAIDILVITAGGNVKEAMTTT
jgi:NAD(P)-dependent dehydrogenase (short-subunit alcohol dehydrogenase family)